MFFLRKLNKIFSQQNNRFVKAILIREVFKYKKNHIFQLKTLFLDRIKLIIFVVFMPFLYIKFKKFNNNFVFVDPFAKSKNVYNLRKKFIFNYDNIEVESLNYTDGIYISSINEFFSFLKQYFINIFIVFQSFFDYKNIKYMFLVSFFMNSLNIKLRTLERVYIFNFLDSGNYLLTLFLSENFNNKNIYYVYSIGHIYTFGRYDKFNENVTIILTSKVQYSEIEYLRSIGLSISSGNIKIWGNDNSIDSKIDKTIKFDIGIFSSSDWARGKNGLIIDAKKLKKGKFGNNLAYLVFQEVISEIPKLIKKYNLKVKLYFHPSEKRLWHNYKILPPYIKYIDKNLIDISDIENNDISNYFESKIGIVVQSSIFYLREHSELKTYFFYDKNRIDNPRLFLNIKILSEYLSQTYTTGKDLNSKLEYFFNEKRV